MTDWPAIIDADFAVPADAVLADLVDELTDALCSPDPVRRDDQAYPVLGTWILAGHLDDQMAALGMRVIGLFDHPEIQARTFAALILASWFAATGPRGPDRAARRGLLATAL